MKQTTNCGDGGEEVATKVHFIGTAMGMPDEHVDAKDLLDINKESLTLKKVCVYCVKNGCVWLLMSLLLC